MNENAKSLPIEDRIKAITKSMTHQTPDNKQIIRIEVIRNAYISIVPVILKNTPEGRNQSIAITELENSLMRAVKAIVLEDKK